MNFNLKTPGSLPRPEMRGGLGIPLGGGNLGINADYQGYGRGERPDYGGSISYKRQF
jgi:hypothetical protein